MLARYRGEVIVDHGGPFEVLGVLFTTALLLSVAAVLGSGALRLLDTPGAVELALASASAGVPATTTTTVAATTTTAEPAPARPSSEVRVRVGNGAQQSGLASSGGGVLTMWGFQVVDTTNAPPQDASVVFHREGFAAEAGEVAEILEIDEVAVAPEDLALPLDGADVLVLYGSDAAS